MIWMVAGTGWMCAAIFGVALMASKRVGDASHVSAEQLKPDVPKTHASRAAQSSLAEQSRRPGLVNPVMRPHRWSELNPLFKGIGGNRGAFMTFGKDGKLNSPAIEAVALDAEEIHKVEQAYSNLKDRTKSLLKSSLKEDPRRSKPDEGVLAYTIPSFSEQSAPLLEEFVRSVDGAIGRQRRDVLLGGYQIESEYSGFGLNETLIEVRKLKKKEFSDDREREMYEATMASMGVRNPELRVKSEQRDGATGKVRITSEGSFDSFNEKYGGVLPVEN